MVLNVQALDYLKSLTTPLSATTEAVPCIRVAGGKIEQDIGKTEKKEQNGRESGQSVNEVKAVIHNLESLATVLGEYDATNYELHATKLNSQIKDSANEGLEAVLGEDQVAVSSQEVVKVVAKDIETAKEQKGAVAMVEETTSLDSEVALAVVPAWQATQEESPAKDIEDTDIESVKMQGLDHSRWNYDWPEGFFEKYVLVELLGEGGNGSIFVAIQISSQIRVAVKIVDAQCVHWFEDGENGYSSFEIDHLRYLQDDIYVINYIEHFFNPGHSDIVLVTELFGTSWSRDNMSIDSTRYPNLKYESGRAKKMNLDGSVQTERAFDLYGCIRAHTSVPIETARFIFAQVVVACFCLQENQILHGDVKDKANRYINLRISRSMSSIE